LYLCRNSFNPFAFDASATLSIVESDHTFALPFLKPRPAPDHFQRKIALAGDEMNPTIAMLTTYHYCVDTS